MTVSAGSQRRLIKQHYCRKSINRQIDVLFHIPAYLIWNLIKSLFIASHIFESNILPAPKKKKNVLNKVVRFIRYWMFPLGVNVTMCLSCASLFFAHKCVTQAGKICAIRNKYYSCAEQCIRTPCCILSEQSKRQSTILIRNQFHKGSKLGVFCADS